MTQRFGVLYQNMSLLFDNVFTNNTDYRSPSAAKSDPVVQKVPHWVTFSKYQSYYSYGTFQTDPVGSKIRQWVTLAKYCHYYSNVGNWYLRKRCQQRESACGRESGQAWFARMIKMMRSSSVSLPSIFVSPINFSMFRHLDWTTTISPLPRRGIEVGHCTRKLVAGAGRKDWPKT